MTTKFNVGDHFKTTKSTYNSTVYIVREVRPHGGATSRQELRLAYYNEEQLTGEGSVKTPKEIGWHLATPGWNIIKKAQRERKGFSAFIFKVEQQAA